MTTTMLAFSPIERAFYDEAARRAVSSRSHSPSFPHTPPSTPFPSPFLLPALPSPLLLTYDSMLSPDMRLAAE